jgi:transposase
MRQKSNSTPASSETLVRNIRRATRKHHAAEEKIRIVLDGRRGETSIAELCRREGIAESMYYSWSKEFLEAGKRRLAGDTARAATTDEVKQLRREIAADDESTLADLLQSSSNTLPARDFDTKNLRKAAEADLDKLAALRTKAAKISPKRDPKLKVLITELTLGANQRHSAPAGAAQAEDSRGSVATSFMDLAARTGALRSARIAI